jgi:uncharacterized protein YbjT (DUF2867 family)
MRGGPRGSAGRVKALVLGPTGVVGDAIIREALEDRRIASILAVSRRPLTPVHPKLETVILRDFSGFEPLRPALAGVDYVLCALGISWYQTSGEAQYRLITHDYVMACARVAAIANPAMHFCFVSGHGASARGSQAWARIKAETEHDLDAVFGSRLTVFRPGYIYPAFGRPIPYWGDTVMKPLMPFRTTLSKWITDSRAVAQAVLHCGTGGTVPSPATNADIAAAASAYTKAREKVTASS